MGWERTYLCIDLKSFYASVECTDRGLDPFATDLVVADPERSANTICLAITPSMKAKGVRNRCRVRDIPAGMAYITAVPRMRRFMEVSAEIYRTYLEFVSAEDAWPYSVDECFLDATPYLGLYGTDARTLARRMVAAVGGARASPPRRASGRTCSSRRWRWTSPPSTRATASGCSTRSPSGARCGSTTR